MREKVGQTFPSGEQSASSRLSSLWRYPVKSMGGEELREAEVTAAGLLGDRAYAFVDAANKVGTAKKRPDLLQCRARFVDPPQIGAASPAVLVTMPDGTSLTNERASLDETVSKLIAHRMTLKASAPQGLALEFAAGTLGGKYAELTESPVAGGAPAGTFFDFAVVHLLTTSTLERLREAYPEGRFDMRRFRPNIVVETSQPGFVENSWIGRTLALGDEVLLRVSIPCPRCVMPTLPQADLPHDPGILRTVVGQNRLNLGDYGELPCVGVYANVLRPGRIRPGDALCVVE